MVVIYYNTTDATAASTDEVTSAVLWVDTFEVSDAADEDEKPLPPVRRLECLWSVDIEPVVRQHNGRRVRLALPLRFSSLAWPSSLLARG